MFVLTVHGKSTGLLSEGHCAVVFERMSQGMARQGVGQRVVPLHETPAAYDRVKRLILFGEGESEHPLERQHFLFHEAVHATTDRLIRTQYNPKNAARGIVFRAEGDKPLTNLLPMGYQYLFYADERVAFNKSGIYARQIETEIKALNLDIIPSADQAKLSEIFASVSREILTLFRDQIEAEQRTGQILLKLSLYLYNDDTPELEYVVLQSTQYAGGFIQIIIPIPSTEAEPARQEVLSQVLEVIGVALN